MDRRSTKGAHQAPRQRPRREPLNDHYYYQEPPRSSRQGTAGRGDSFEDISSYSSHAHRSRQRDQRDFQRKKKKRHTGLIAACVFLVLIGAGVWYVFGYLLHGLTINELSRDNLGIHAEATTNADIKNIALFGLDARENVSEGRSDALMILTIDNKHKKLKLTSILRDSCVWIEDYGEDKITHAYAYGGPELAVKTLNQNFRLDIEDYATVNFIQMAEIVDAFGGTRVTISYDEMNEINRNLAMQQSESYDADISEADYMYEDGDVLLNGNQAVAYARIRYLDGDDVRASRQQNVLKGLVEQLKTVSKLQYPELIRTVAPMCTTSLNIPDMLGLTPILLSDFTMETLSVPGEEEGAESGYTEEGAWVYLYDLEEAAQHISRFIYEEDSPYYYSESPEEEG